MPQVVLHVGFVLANTILLIDMTLHWPMQLNTDTKLVVDTEQGNVRLTAFGMHIYKLNSSSARCTKLVSFIFRTSALHHFSL